MNSLLSNRRQLALKEGSPTLIFRDTNVAYTKIDSHEQIQIYARVARESSAALLVFCWHIFKGRDELIWDADIDIQTFLLDCILHDRLVERKLSVRVAPRRLKTTIFSLIHNVGLWMLHPSYKFMFITYGGPLIAEQVNSLRNIINHDHFLALQEEIYKLDNNYSIFKIMGDVNSTTTLGIDTGGSRISGKSGEGEVAGGTANVLVMDDMHNPKVMMDSGFTVEEISNELLRARNKYDTLFGRRVVPGGMELSIGHKMADGDMQDYCIKDLQWPVVSLPLMYNPRLEVLSDLDPRHTEGQLLHKNMHEKFPDDLTKRRQNMANFCKLDQHDTYISDNTMFPLSAWRMLTIVYPSTSSFEQGLHGFIKLNLSHGGILLNCWDHASTTNVNSKFTCRVRMIFRAPYFYILDVMKFKKLFNDMEEEFLRDCMEYPESVNVVENANNGVVLYQRHNPNDAEVWDTINNPLRLMMVTTSGIPKKTRASFTAAELRDAHIKLVNNILWNVSFTAEHQIFKNVTDQIDACSLGIWGIRTQKINMNYNGDLIELTQAFYSPEGRDGHYKNKWVNLATITMDDSETEPEKLLDNLSDNLPDF